MSNRSILKVITKSEEFRIAKSYYKKFSKKSIGLRYILAKKCFESVQRRYDMHWATDCMISSTGDFCGVRLNTKRFFKLAKVKKQVEAARSK